MNSYLIRGDENLSSAGKKIFGDVLKDIHIAVHYDKDIDSLEETKSVLNNQLRFISCDNNIIDNDGIIIVLTLINGNKVFISNSEWGSIYSSDLTTEEV